MKTATTKERIIKNGAALIHSQGYHHTGISEILAAAGVPKGSFYFYFKSKDEFGLAVLDYYQHFIEGMAEAYCSDRTLAPLVRFERFIDAYHDLFASLDFCRGCPIGNIMQEMSDQNEDFRCRVAQIYDQMKGFIARLLEEARDNGDLPTSLDPSRTAQFILNSWEGAIMHMKLVKSDEPLRLFKQMVFERILT